MKIVHRIIPTNNWLFKCNLVNTKNCNFCKIHTETIEHLFWECPISKTLWLRVFEWLQNLNVPSNPFTIKNTLLGDNSEKLSVKHIKIITKNFIYNAKINDNLPSFNQLLPLLKYKISIDKYSMRNHVFKQKWERNILEHFGLYE